MKKQVTWTLKNGAEATYTIELVLEKEINLDGDKSIVPCCEIRSNFDIPGIGYIGGEMIIERTVNINGVECVAVVGNKVALTAEVYAAIKAAKAGINSHPAIVTKKEASERNERERKSEYASRIKNGYCPKCHSYCHGDCGR